MVSLPQTEEALATMAANQHFGTGSHTEHMIRTGIPGQELGHVPFDPARHGAHQIDPLATPSLITGQEHVRQVLPGRPLALNVVADYSSVAEHSAITQAKRSVVAELTASIDNASPDMFDRVFIYKVGDAVPTKTSRDEEVIPIEEGDEAELSRTVAEIAAEGLTIVLSDFNRLRLPADQTFDSLVAIKVNHLLQRRIPQNIGLLSLEGASEVNTNNPSQVNFVNRRLQHEHQAIVNELRGAGVAVASIVAQPKLTPHMFNPEAVDNQLATVLRAVE